MFKYLMFIIVGALFGTFVLKILENIGLNVWLARFIACMAAGLCGILMDKVLFNK